VFTRPAKTLRPPLAVPPRPGSAPRCSSHLPGLWVTRHQRGFTHVRPSGLPLACVPGWNGPASASSLSSAPRSYPQRTSGRGLALNTGQELRHRHHAGPPITCSLTTCHLVSHILGPVITDEQPHMLSRPKFRIWPAACGRTISALMKQCSRPAPGGRARHPSSDQLSRPASRGTVCQRGSDQPGLKKCSPASGYRHRVCRMATR
jgi:hypothetical protein